MTYSSSKPAGADSLKSSDDTIRANFAQIVANFSNQHVWSDDTATNVLHYRASGIITRVLTSAGAPSSAGIVDEDLSFSPSLVVFDFNYANGTSMEILSGHGYAMPGINYVNEFFSRDTTTWQEFGDNSFCVGVYDALGVYQAAVCSFGINKFTLTWEKLGATTGTLYIFYTAFG